MLVVITDYQYDNIDAERRIIGEAGFELRDYQVKDAKELIPLVKDADAIITQYSDVSREVIGQLEHCKMIIKYGIGVNNIDTKAATEKGIYVCNVPDYGVEEVSDHAVTMMLALGKKMQILEKAFREGDWGYASTMPLYRLRDCTLGLVGFGRIPQLVAKKMAGFGLRILAYDPFVDEEKARAMGVRPADLETILRESDFISVHVPLNEGTRHLIGRESFEKMKKTAFVVNTARGGVIDEKALVEALKAGEIAGAGVDVYGGGAGKHGQPAASHGQCDRHPSLRVVQRDRYHDPAEEGGGGSGERAEGERAVQLCEPGRVKAVESGECRAV